MIDFLNRRAFAKLSVAAAGVLAADKAFALNEESIGALVPPLGSTNMSPTAQRA